MVNQASETTRILCANAFTGGARFRRRIFEYMKEKHQAHAPEMGIDVPLLAAVCKQADRREVAFAVIFFCLAAVSGLVLGASSPETYPVIAGLIILVLGILYFVKLYRERCVLTRPFLRHNFDLNKLQKNYKVAEHEKNQLTNDGPQNLIVYKGFSPFVGAGIDFGGWSFSLSTIKDRDRDGDALKPVPFQTSELYAGIEAGLSALSIDAMSIEDYFFVSGSDIRSDREILPDEIGRPITKLTPASAENYKHRCDNRIRHYRWIRVEDWGGEIQMSMFLRCALRGTSLFVELKRYLLTPLANKYKRIDKVSKPSAGNLLTWLLLAFLAAPWYALYASIFLVVRCIGMLSRLLGLEERKKRKEIREDPLYNYGAEQTLRTQFSSGEYHHYFQKIDTDFYSKVLEQEILDSIVSFLEDHNIDTSEIRESKKVILNSGIIVHGGDVKADTLAVGEGAKAVKKAVTATLKTTKE